MSLLAMPEEEDCLRRVTFPLITNESTTLRIRIRRVNLHELI